MMEEDNLKMKDFPKEIQDKMRTFNLRVGAYNKKPSEEEYEKLVKSSTVIADEMQSHIESPLPEVEDTTAADAAAKEQEDATWLDS